MIKFPSIDKRVGQSMQERARLIAALRRVLAEEQAPSEEARQRLKRRIACLEARNAEPVESLGLGAHLRQVWRHGSCESAW